MSRRRTDGNETWNRLRVWSKGQTSAERLAAHVLRANSYESIDPSHPLGGPDGLKDVICLRNKLRWIGAAYFPNDAVNFRQTKKKFQDDFKGVKANNVDGIAFVTNQHLTLTQRKELKAHCGETKVDLFHLERVANILDSTECYGIRLEFLDIEMTKEEQVAFIALRDKAFEDIKSILLRIEPYLRSPEIAKRVPISEIIAFQEILDSISSPVGLLFSGGHISKLKVPINEMREFEIILDDITSPLRGKLRPLQGHIDYLKVPLDKLEKYQRRLNRILKKWKEIEEIQQRLQTGLKQPDGT